MLVRARTHPHVRVRNWPERKGNVDMTSDKLHEDGSPEGTVAARDTSGQREAQAKPDSGVPTKPQTVPKETDASVPSQDAGWAGASTSQVARTVAIALLTTAVVLGALFLLWQVRTF